MEPTNPVSPLSSPQASTPPLSPSLFPFGFPSLSPLQEEIQSYIEENALYQITIYFLHYFYKSQCDPVRLNCMQIISAFSLTD